MNVKEKCILVASTPSSTCFPPRGHGTTSDFCACGASTTSLALAWLIRVVQRGANCFFSSKVHVTGGASALVAAIMLGPRLNRFDDEHSVGHLHPNSQCLERLQHEFGLSSPVTALTGTFMLWWAWMSFNCASTFGVVGDLWRVTAKVCQRSEYGGLT